MVAPPSTSPLKIAVLGAGKIGSTFAFQLARVGRHDITVIARPDSVRLQQLQRDGGISDVKGERASVRVIDTLDEETSYDLLIVTLLDHQANAMMPTLQRSAAKTIQFMFNTFHPERLQDAIGAERCAFGMPFVQATLSTDGKLKTTIGAAGQKTIMSEQRWVDVFSAAGLPAAVEPDMPLWLRCHVRGVRKRIGRWRAACGGRFVGRSSHLGARSPRKLRPRQGARLPRLSERETAYRQLPTAGVAAILWFLSRIRGFREVLATGKAECQVLVDVMVTAAPLANQPVAVSDILAMKPS